MRLIALAGLALTCSCLASPLLKPGDDMSAAEEVKAYFDELMRRVRNGEFDSYYARPEWMKCAESCLDEGEILEDSCPLEGQIDFCKEKCGWVGSAQTR